jgi:hypothetical protein
MTYVPSSKVLGYSVREIVERVMKKIEIQNSDRSANYRPSETSNMDNFQCFFELDPTMSQVRCKDNI